LTASPSEIDWHGEHITINEAWAEHQSRRLYTVVLIPGFLHIPINRQLPGYCIGINLKQGYECFHGPHAPFFVRENSGAGFGEVWPAGYFFDTMPAYDNAPIKVRLIEAWHSGDTEDIILTPQP
jgi:hypothetical protein